ncbi:MAG: hypothetical protein L0H75_00725, partial [Nitrosospira sp.]|nr:hypothetical protein [Nitrosospira sp.]
MTSIINKQGSVKSSSPSQNDAPDRPRLVLRIGFAGSRDLANNECTQLKTTLNGILRILGGELTNIAPYGSDSSNDTSFSEFFSKKEPPLLRLITGLCEGADAIAGEALEEIKEINKTSDTEKDFRCFNSELAAVLPFDVVTYRQCRDERFRNEFDRQLAVCSWIQVLDGIYDKPDAAELTNLSSEQEKKNRRDLANLRRARAYRAQGAFLLRHSDILIAAANPDSNKGKAGGTMETIRSA